MPTRQQSSRHATRTQPNTATADKRRIFVTDAIRSGLPPHIAAKVCGHSTVDTTMGYANPRELRQTG
jgi:hypothetical protein